MVRPDRVTRSGCQALAVIGLVGLAACVSEPPHPLAMEQEAPPDTNVYFYPAQGHAVSANQQDRDKYECNTWAVQKTGFDPSVPTVPPHQRIGVVPPAVHRRGPAHRSEQ